MCYRPCVLELHSESVEHFDDAMHPASNSFDEPHVSLPLQWPSLTVANPPASLVVSSVENHFRSLHDVNDWWGFKQWCIFYLWAGQ